MACAHPWMRKPNKDEYIPHWKINSIYIPCGMCLNCRVDKQNELSDRCEKELINYKCGAFVTLTYDDYHIVEHLRYNSKGELVATLSKKDCKKYIDRLRHNIKNHLPDCILSNHHFKQLCVGEYGGDGQIFDRPHIHMLFFGLDFAFCKKEFEKAWQGKGIIKVLPILDGGINYVLKYLDKQLFGEQAKIKYDNNNLERPFQTHSLGLGSSLFNEQKDYIKSHNGCYRWKGKDRPVPMYYRNKLLTSIPFAQTYNNSQANYKLYNGEYAKSFYDLHDFQIKKAELREKNINNKLFMKGRPRFDWMSINDMKYYSRQYISSLVQKCVNSDIPF